MYYKLLILSFIVAVSANNINYNDYVLYKITPNSEKALETLKALYKTPNGLTFWMTPTSLGDPVSVISPPAMRKEFEGTIKDMEVEIISENIQKDIDAHALKRRRRNVRDGPFWDGFQTMEDIYGYFDNLAKEHSDIVTMFHVGTSFEGRNITGIKISRGSGNKAFILQGGEIGADWISPVVVTYIADMLVKGEDPEALAATEEFDWHIIPITNPDGFEYTQNVDRLWVKNRRIDSVNPTGVDLTKNWNNRWGAVGGSFDNKADKYVGLGPFSEIETRALSGYLHSLDSQITGLLSFRAFGQRLLIPFASEEQYNNMITIGRRALGSLAVKYNTQYLAGTSEQVSDGATGDIGGWAQRRFNPPIVATYLLRNLYSFLLPVDQVLPSCEETFDSVMAILREARFINVI